MRTVTTLLLSPLCTVALTAQCFVATGGTSAGLVAVGTDPVDDEGLSAPIDMLFGPAGFPMAGAVGPLTHAVVDSNGALYLTSGGAAVGRVGFGPFDLTDLRGQVGDSPRIAPLWGDLEGTTAGWAVNVDTSVAGRFQVTWIDVEEYTSGAPQFSFSATLYATGQIEFAYGALPPLPNANFYIVAGVSIGNGVGTGLEISTDLTTGPNSGALGLLFQDFDGAVPSVADKTILLLPNGTGGFSSVVSCQAGAHTAYGAGCYGESVYQYFADAAVASAALQGNALLLVPTGTGYVTTWVPGAAAAFYVAPAAGAVSLPITNDGNTVITPTIALPVPGGAAAQLTIEHNGIVVLGALPNHLFDWTPTPAELLAAPNAGFYSWHDYNDAEPGSGTIKQEERLVGAERVLFVTWDGVENYSTPTAVNPSTIQFQLNLTTGVVTYVWLSVDDDSTSIDGSAHLVGYTGPGVGSDPGPFPFAVAGSTVTIDTFRALTLRAGPSPVIGSGGSSNLITWTLDDMPDFAPPSGQRLGILFFSLQSAPGIDLGFVGVPGCQVYLNSLDAQAPISVSGSSSQGLSFNVPPPLAPGFSFYAQGVALIPVGSYPGGLNTLGLLTSNGVRTTF